MAKINGELYKIKKTVVENLKSNPFSIFNELKRQGMSLKNGQYKCDVIDPVNPNYFICHVTGEEIVQSWIAP